MKHWYGVAVTVAAGMALAGCAADDVVVKRQAEMEARLESLLQSNKAVNAQLAGLSGEVQELKGRVKAGSTDIENLKSGQKELNEALAATHSRRIASETSAAPAAKIEVVNRDASREKDGGSQDAYMKAYGLYGANNYEQAIEAFTAFMRDYPDSEYTANAQYWIGECHYTRSNLPLALDAFRKVVSNYPQAKKVPDAMLKAAFTLYAMHDQEKGRAMLENLVEKYPASPAAGKARERMSRK